METHARNTPSLPSHRGSAPLDTRRRSIATRAPLHVVADLDRDFVSIVPRNPNHQRCLLHRNSTRNKKKERNAGEEEKRG